jgi:hypothetical protein
MVNDGGRNGCSAIDALDIIGASGATPALCVTVVALALPSWDRVRHPLSLSVTFFPMNGSK